MITNMINAAVQTGWIVVAVVTAVSVVLALSAFLPRLPTWRR